MADHIANRERIVAALREELVGPSPQGDPLDCSGEVRFDEEDEFYRPWRQAHTGEEILQRDRPLRRYGVGVLYPACTPVENDGALEEPEAEDVVLPPVPGDEPDTTIPDMPPGDAVEGEFESADLDEFELSAANALRPSTMGISFLVELPRTCRLVLELRGGRYRRRTILCRQEERVWWVRSSVAMRAEFEASSLLGQGTRRIRPTRLDAENAEHLHIDIEVLSRPYDGDEVRLLTAYVVNRAEPEGAVDEYCLFQVSLTGHIESTESGAHILPYPSAPIDQLDEEERSLALLYRAAQTYGVGHGCAADWLVSPNGDRALRVSAESLPVVETPSITGDVLRGDGSPLQVGMQQLADALSPSDVVDLLQEVIRLYREWVEDRRGGLGALPPQYHGIAEAHLRQCERAAARMERGLRHLQGDPIAWRAFQLANQAVLLQQAGSRDQPRRAHYRPKQKRIEFEGSYVRPSPTSLPTGRGYWRAFQIAFLLLCVESVADSTVSDRSTVDLLWFPTGGGKTEAYLGLAAFAMFLRRLRDPSDVGCSALMRYTLRLLTAQQFQRGARLLCAMEYIRRQDPAALGEAAFSIGIWLGSETTPNTRKQAVDALRRMHAPGRQKRENRFLLNQCPWCGAEMGRLERQNIPRAHRVSGAKTEGDSVLLYCPDASCDFHDRLPVYVTDEDIYEECPSLLIGTVDKFAMLAWQPKARALFGIGRGATRRSSPPDLIIQDELHLISGPLGSVAGLYEGLVEELCTDRRSAPPILPKIVCSTATIRRHEEQIRALYGRVDKRGRPCAALFPPPGLDAGDSFFARYAREEDGTRCHGRMYVGVHAPGLASLQTAQVRTLSALQQAPFALGSPEEGDPWWTLMVFFNSLRELGTTLTLFQSDIPDYLGAVRNRIGAQWSQMRRPQRHPLELTGRLPSYEIPSAIEALETTCMSGGDEPPVDVCLASNIIEVGIDIDRLSLMAVIGQPKTTSQYIQVTGRVGRSWWERPGLIVTIYSPSKPRDRSHFEKFRSYHERLYAQVEPTSVTPFSPRVLDRALHAVLVAYVRQTGALQDVTTPYPCPVEMIQQFRSILRQRVLAVDQDEVATFDRVLDERTRQWATWQPTQWGTLWQATDDSLITSAGTYVPPDLASLIWPTPTSMRNVDAECQVNITQLYLTEGGNEGA